MIENEVIVRLESMVERLNGVLEQNLLSEYKKQQIRISSKEKAISKLLKIEPILSNLVIARSAKEYILSARSYRQENARSSYFLYLSAASIVYEIIRDTTFNSCRVWCGVEIEPALNKALKKAMQDNVKALEVYNFINLDTPELSWSYDDRDEDFCNKSFKLVKSEEEFTNLLKKDYMEITGPGMGGIRIAFKKERVSIILPQEQEAKAAQLSEFVTNIYELQGCIEILYPDILYNGTYQIYVPTK